MINYFFINYLYPAIISYLSCLEDYGLYKFVNFIFHYTDFLKNDRQFQLDILKKIEKKEKDLQFKEFSN